MNENDTSLQDHLLYLEEQYQQLRRKLRKAEKALNSHNQFIADTLTLLRKEDGKLSSDVLKPLLHKGTLEMIDGLEVVTANSLELELAKDYYRDLLTPDEQILQAAAPLSEPQEKSPKAEPVFFKESGSNTKTKGRKFEAVPTEDGPKNGWQKMIDDIMRMMLAECEKGIVPWRRTWDALSRPMLAMNAATNKFYKGVNMYLSFHPLVMEKGDPRFCTYKQAEEKGWHVRKGEKACAKIYKFIPFVLDKDGAMIDTSKMDKRAVQQLIDEGGKEIAKTYAYPAFHASQIEGIPEFKAEIKQQVDWTAPEIVQKLLGRTGVNLTVGGNEAFYVPSSDRLNLPPVEAFHSAEDYASTALHEHGHSTGHEKRLNRSMKGRFGSPEYGKEELIAELSSVYTAAAFGIKLDFENHASYMSSHSKPLGADNWADLLKKNPTIFYEAQKAAIKSFEYTLGLMPEFKGLMDEPEAEEAKQEKVTQTKIKPSLSTLSA